MSNNAVEAYNRGLLPLSKISASLLKQGGWQYSKGFAVYLAKAGEWLPEEWHHTSKEYNETNFYSISGLIEYWEELDDISKESLLGKYSLAKTKMETEKRVVGTYKEFSGHGRYNRRVYEVRFEGVLRGNWIYLKGGGKKRASGNWIEYKIV
jgi:hypothetical protein